MKQFYQTSTNWNINIHYSSWTQTQSCGSLTHQNRNERCSTKGKSCTEHWECVTWSSDVFAWRWLVNMSINVLRECHGLCVPWGWDPMWEHSQSYLRVLVGHLKPCIHTHSAFVCSDRKALTILSLAHTHTHTFVVDECLKWICCVPLIHMRRCWSR